MRLTSFSDFGLRPLMRMASALESAFSTAALAQEFGLSYHHLTKIMATLAQAGFVTTDAAAVAQHWQVRHIKSAWARWCAC